jgi:cell division septum initiation protein DivIVA
MSEERFDQIEKMMVQLIQMVGHNNAVTEELRQDVSGLKQDVAGLKQDVSGLKQDAAGLRQDIVALDAKMEKGFADVVTMINVLGEKVDKIETTQAKHSDLLEVFAVRTTNQEAEILGLKRAK